MSARNFLNRLQPSAQVGTGGWHSHLAQRIVQLKTLLKEASQIFDPEVFAVLGFQCSE